MLCVICLGYFLIIFLKIFISHNDTGEVKVPNSYKNHKINITRVKMLKNNFNNVYNLN